MKRILPFLTFILFIAASPAQAGEDPIYTGIFNDRAAGGYDVVSYFTDGKAVKGDKKFQTDYMGAKWRFTSEEHLNAFLANPTQYAPQYGGYCAWAMGRGYTAKGDPEVWRIVEGKLYLNYDESVKAQWETDIPGFIMKADVNYPKLVDLEE
ncbi:YHS domain-containing (seleno)protein [Kordiimonas lacus]|uniref:YHS domain-containing protein n=1 Tax=Kordiimonas lacus TaxID=637679 RepID=A0A1G6YHG4_9PROT|nr:YHS domain-containing (seleno)protein [Kordiimonas lacus]SDD89924.1 YHS domain-containing protein [Kordiimonas lacus]